MLTRVTKWEHPASIMGENSHDAETYGEWVQAEIKRIGKGVELIREGDNVALARPANQVRLG